MDLESLRLLVAQGESESLEFKKTTGELKAGMATLCAMLNGPGGRVLYGVTAAGKVLGQEVRDTTLQDVAREIKKLEPPAHIEQTRIPVRDDKQVLILGTTVAPDGPYSYDGRAYQRVGPTTSLMPRSEYQRRLLARTHALDRWENQVAERYRLDELDTPEIEQLVAGAINAGRLESRPANAEEALDRLNLRVDGRLLRAAMVLFGRKLLPFYPQCGLRLARFRGTTKTEFLDQKQLHGHAFRLLEEASLFLHRHVPVAGRIEPDRPERQDRPLYPPLALREALVNALCHRDYTIAGGAVSVAMYDDRLEIISTGLLPAGITVADLKRDHLSRPRNPLIADAFFRRGWIERWGRGTQKIVELCQAAGQPEPEFEERAGDVVVRFIPSGYVPPHQVTHNLTDRQRRILHLLGDGMERSAKKLATQMTSPIAPATLRRELTLLRDLGLVESGGHGRGAYWRLGRTSGVPLE